MSFRRPSLARFSAVHACGLWVAASLIASGSALALGACSGPTPSESATENGGSSSAGTATTGGSEPTASGGTTAGGSSAFGAGGSSTSGGTDGGSAGSTAAGASGASGGTASGGSGGQGGVVADCEIPEPGEGTLKIACIGDSITFGVGADAADSYPSQLGALLGAGYDVENFGVSATTMLKNGSYPYWYHGYLTEAEALLPDVVLIGLGTNDMGSGSAAHLDEFVGDYIEMVELFQNLESHPTVFALLPAWEEDDDIGILYTDARLEEEIIPRILEAANATGACTIDLHTVTHDHPEYYADKLHPNAAGYAVIAETVCQALLPGCPGN
jgi:lysophospholipase L1-like esterase